MNNTCFGAIHYEIHLDMELDYTISRIFQEMSLSELETFHLLCELERTQILQSLALAVLKIPYAGYFLSGNRSIFIDYEGNILWYYPCTKKLSPLYVFEDKRCYKRIPILYKNKVYFVDTLSRRTYFWDTAVPFRSEYSHNVVQFNPDEDKCYLLTPYPTRMPPLKKFSPESIKAIARNKHKHRYAIIRYLLQIGHTTSHPHATISRTPHKNGHNTETIHRPKFTKHCRNRRISNHLHKRLQWTL